MRGSKLAFKSIIRGKQLFHSQYNTRISGVSTPKSPLKADEILLWDNDPAV